MLHPLLKIPGDIILGAYPPSKVVLNLFDFLFNVSRILAFMRVLAARAEEEKQRRKQR
jgi:hypothetical protein